MVAVKEAAAAAVVKETAAVAVVVATVAVAGGCDCCLL